jgi:hypothetical protein
MHCNQNSELSDRVPPIVVVKVGSVELGTITVPNRDSINFSRVKL